MNKRILLFVVLTFLLSGCGNKKENIEQLTVESELSTQATEEITEEENITDESLLSWDEKDITIPGVEKEYEIWFLADSHIIVQDGNENEEVASYAAQRIPGFANEMGVSSDKIFAQFIDLANEQKPDMILFGGDILDFPSEANVSYLQTELDRLEVPFVFAMGNHDWTFPWEYMTPEGSEKYRPMLEKNMYGNFSETEAGTDGNVNDLTVMGNTYAVIIELDDLVILSVDDSSNQVAAEALEGIEYAYGLEKPIILMQHVPFSTENLIAKAKEAWANPVTLGMQVHGGIAPNDVSKNLWDKTHDDDSLIKVVLAGHVHFPYEEQLSDATVEIITDAAFKGKAVKLHISDK